MSRDKFQARSGNSNNNLELCHSPILIGWKRRAESDLKVSNSISIKWIIRNIFFLELNKIYAM